MDHDDYTSNLTSDYDFDEAYAMMFCFSYDTIDKMRMATKYLNFIYDAIGIPLNAWILVAILTSTDLRSRMRNKMLAGVCVQGLLDCLVLLPLLIFNYSDPVHYFSSCHTHRAHEVILFFSEFVSNWNLVTLLALVLFTLYGSSVTLGGWNRSLTQAVSYGVLLWPWLFSAITVIPTILSNYEEFSFELTDNVTVCVTSLGRVERALFVVDIGVPACVSAAMLAAIIYLNRRRANVITSGGELIATRQLIGGESESEPSTPYIAIVVIFFVSDIGLLVHVVDSTHPDESTVECVLIIVRLIVNCLLGLRDFLLPLAFLLFPEVRYRATKLLQRVARRGRRGADVTITYVKAA